MTLALHLTVQDIGDGPAPIDVLLAANVDDLVVPQGWGTDSNAITSTTEGRISGAELRLVFDQDDCPLQVGQVVTLTGDFAPADPDDEEQVGAPAEGSTAPDDEPRPATTRKRAAKKAPAKKTTAKKAASK